MTTTSVAVPDAPERIRPQRLRPLTALRAFGRLVRDKEDTGQVFRIMQALSGRSAFRGYCRLLATVEGGREAFQRVELAERLDDPAWLARFGPDTVGAAYRAFRQARGFSADGLAAVEREVLPHTDQPHPVVWYSRRIRDVHDIWHVLTGYGTDALGEACVVSFSYGQTRNLGFAFIGLGAAAEIRRESRRMPAFAAVLQAWRTGRTAQWLPALDYEQLFEEPLDAARARLGLRVPTVYAGVPEADRNALKLRAA